MLGRLARGALDQGEIDRARELAEESSRLVDETGFVRGQAIAADLFAGIARADGDHERAARLLARSAELAAGSEFTWWQGVTLLELAELELERGRTAKGEQRAREALAPLAEVGDRQNVALRARAARPRRGAGRSRGARRTVVGRDRGRGGARAGRRVGAAIASEHCATPSSRRPATAFDSARAEGRVLALADAIAFAVKRLTPDRDRRASYTDSQTLPIPASGIVAPKPKLPRR